MERVRETLKFEVELVRLIWFGLIADVGGTVSLMRRLEDGTDFVLVGLGTGMAGVLVWWLVVTTRKVRSLIERLEG